MTNWTYIEELRGRRDRNNVLIENYAKVIKKIDESNFFLRFIHSGEKDDAKRSQLRLHRKNLRITDEILFILRTAQFVMGDS